MPSITLWMAAAVVIASVVYAYGRSHSARRLRRKLEALPIRELTSRERYTFLQAWRIDDIRFGSDPARRLAEAERLIAEVLRLSGYIKTDFEENADAIALERPALVQRYRAARAVFERCARGRAAIEDLRAGLIYYRALLMDLVGDPRQVELATFAGNPG